MVGDSTLTILKDFPPDSLQRCSRVMYTKPKNNMHLYNYSKISYVVFFVYYLYNTSTIHVASASSLEALPNFKKVYMPLQ